MALPYMFYLVFSCFCTVRHNRTCVLKRPYFIMYIHNYPCKHHIFAMELGLLLTFFKTTTFFSEETDYYILESVSNRCNRFSQFHIFLYESCYLLLYLH